MMPSPMSECSSFDVPWGFMPRAAAASAMLKLSWSAAKSRRCSAFAVLRSADLRLEQERIPRDYAAARLTEAFGVPDPSPTA